MSKQKAVVFHHRYYRYVRMMLRRYPTMRTQFFSTLSGPGIAGITGESSRDALKRIAGLK